MAKFCGICGTRLEETTGLCPNCDMVKELQHAVVTEEVRTEEQSTKPTFGQKLKRFFVRLILWLLLIAVILGGGAGALTYWGIVDIPYVGDVLQIIGIEPQNNDKKEESQDTSNNSTDTQTEQQGQGQTEIPEQHQTEEQTQNQTETQAQDQTDSQSQGNSQEQNTAHTHTYKASKKTDATCTNGGYTLYQCSCGKSYKDDVTSALGHNYKSTVVAATAKEQGYTLHACTRCGHSYKDSYTEKDSQAEQPGDSSEDATYTINHTDVTLRIGESLPLYLSDENGKRVNVSWTSSNSSIVTVVGNSVTGVSAGNAKITAEYKGNTYSCIVRVVPSTIDFDDLLDKAS